MNRDQKAAVIDEIAAEIKASQAIFAVDYRGITVDQAQTLRERLREADATFRVVKNSLTERAADRAGADELKPLLVGPTALTFARGDAAAAAKAVADFARTHFGRPLRVLLAEDNATNQFVCTAMLKRMGCHVDVAAMPVGVQVHGAVDVDDGVMAGVDEVRQCSRLGDKLLRSCRQAGLAAVEEAEPCSLEL